MYVNIFSIIRRVYPYFNTHKLLLFSFQLPSQSMKKYFVKFFEDLCPFPVHLLTILKTVLMCSFWEANLIPPLPLPGLKAFTASHYLQDRILNILLALGPARVHLSLSTQSQTSGIFLTCILGPVLAVTQTAPIVCMAFYHVFSWHSLLSRPTFLEIVPDNLFFHLSWYSSSPSSEVLSQKCHTLWLSLP